MGSAQIVQFDTLKPFDHVRTNGNCFRVNMSLTPRPVGATACYPKHWRKDRFERIGEIFFVPPGEVIHVRTKSGRQTAIVCEIEPRIVTKWLEHDIEWNDSMLESALHVADRSMYGLLMRATRELSHPVSSSQQLLDLIFPQLAIELARYCAAVSVVLPKHGLAAWRLRLIDERVGEMGKPPSLSELAELCDLSVRQLSRGFRISRQCSIGDYIERARIENAKRLLITGTSVKAVAYSVGFSSPSSFSFAFRRATGISPMYYREVM
jgi:AraC family transcriptional regulator